MKYLIEIFKVLFLSPEAFLIFGLLILVFWYPFPLEYLSNKIQHEADIIKFLAFVPIGFMTKICIDVKELLLPQFDKKRILQAWPFYWKLKIRFYVVLFYAITFSILGIISWALKWAENEVWPLAFLLCSVLGSAIVYFTVYVARIAEQEIFAKFHEES